MMLSAWFALLVPAALPTVTSASSCPSARDVASNLAVLLSDTTAVPGSAVVSSAPDGLSVDLRTEDSGFVANRSVVVGGDCEERAKAAAVVIATWWPVGPAGPRHSEETGREERSRGFGVAAGGYASIVSGSVAPGARAEASFAPRGSAFGVRLAGGGTAAHGNSLAEGQVHWSRVSVELGPTYASRWLRVDAGAVGSLLWVEGSGFSENRQSKGAAAGVTLGVRAAPQWGRIQPWLELRGVAWPQSQQMNVTDAATGSRLSRAFPHGEFQLGAGVALAVF
jgi:hypothetical protein